MTLPAGMRSTRSSTRSAKGVGPPDGVTGASPRAGSPAPLFGSGGQDLLELAELVSRIAADLLDDAVADHVDLAVLADQPPADRPGQAGELSHLPVGHGLAVQPSAPGRHGVCGVPVAGDDLALLRGAA